MLDFASEEKQKTFPISTMATPTVDLETPAAQAATISAAQCLFCDREPVPDVAAVPHPTIQGAMCCRKACADDQLSWQLALQLHEEKSCVAMDGTCPNTAVHGPYCAAHKHLRDPEAQREDDERAAAAAAGQ